MQICSVHRLDFNKAISTRRFAQKEILGAGSWHWASPIPHWCHSGIKGCLNFPLPSCPWLTPAHKAQSQLSLDGCAEPEWGAAPKPGRASLFPSSQHFMVHSLPTQSCLDGAEIREFPALPFPLPSLLTQNCLDGAEVRELPALPFPLPLGMSCL